MIPSFIYKVKMGVNYYSVKTDCRCARFAASKLARLYRRRNVFRWQMTTIFANVYRMITKETKIKQVQYLDRYDQPLD